MGVRIPARHKPATNQLQARSLNPCPQDKVIDKIRGKSTGVARTKLASGSREDSENDLRRVFRSTLQPLEADG
jgi:hypothetical protein